MSKLIYIVSAGHSGSTLLDIVTGTIPNVFSTGELVYLPWQLYRTINRDKKEFKQDICSCLKSFQECEKWIEVIESYSKKIGYDVYKNPFKFRIAFLRSQKYVRNGDLLNRINRFVVMRALKYANIRFIQRLFQKVYLRNIRYNWLLIDTICETQNVEYVVDSSKDPIRMAFLQSYRPNDLYLIVLKRSIYGFVYSYLKHGVDFSNALRSWVKFYRGVDQVLKNMDGLNCLNVNYEDLCSAPVNERKRIASFLNLSDPGSKLTINTHNHHLVAGNPMRYKGRIEIRLDDEWEKKLSTLQKEKIDCIICKTNLKPSHKHQRR